MASKRYIVREKEILHPSKRPGDREARPRNITVYVVWDTQKGSVAAGTPGQHGPGGYEKKSQAKRVADQRNKAEAEMRKDRDKRK